VSSITFTKVRMQARIPCDSRISPKSTIDARRFFNSSPGSSSSTTSLEGRCSFSSEDSYKEVEADQLEGSLLMDDQSTKKTTGLNQQAGAHSNTPSTTQARVAAVAKKAGVVKLSAGQIFKIFLVSLLTLVTGFLATPLLVHVVNQEKAKAQEKAHQETAQQEIAATVIQSAVGNYNTREAARSRADVEASHGNTPSQAYQTTEQTLNIENSDAQQEAMNFLAPIIPTAVSSIDKQLEDADNKGTIKLECKAPISVETHTQITTRKALNQLRNHRFQQRDESELHEYVNRQILSDTVNASVNLNGTDVTRANQLPKPVLSFVASAAFNQGHGPISTIHDGNIEDAMIQTKATVQFNDEQYTGTIASQPGHVNITITSNDDGSFTVTKEMDYAAKLGDKVVSPNYHHTSTAVIRPSDSRYGYTIDSLVHDIRSEHPRAEF
jgi:hypothetical protein